MRVAVASWSSRRAGGVEEYLVLLLSALRGAGLDVAFWHEVEEPQSLGRIPVPSGTADICAADRGTPAAIQQLKDWKPDVLYAQGVRDVDAEAALLDVAPAVFFLHTYTGTCISGRKTFSRPVATPCHRQFGWPCLAHYFPHGCGGNDPITMWRLFQIQSRRLALLRKYDAILTHTEYMRAEMLRHGLEAEVVPYPVEAHSETPAALGSGPWRLLYVARMEALKGGQLLIEALPDVVAGARRPVHALMVGDGPDRAEWERRAEAVQRRNPNLSITFTGWLTQSQVGANMESSDLLVVPSLWPEPFGAVGPAAGHHGLPAAGFAAGGIPQWLIEGVNGHLAPADPPRAAELAKAILRCLADPLHYTALRHGAHTVASQFTMARHLPALLNALERASRRG